MEKVSPDHSTQRRKGLICTCHTLWRMQKRFWSIVGISLILNVGAVFLFYRWPWSTNPKIAEAGSVVWWLLHPQLYMLLCGLLLFFLTALIFVGSRFPCQERDEAVHPGETNAGAVVASGERSVAVKQMTGGMIMTGDLYGPVQGDERKPKS